MKILLSTLNSKYIHSSLALRYLKSYCDREFSHIEISEYTINQNNDYIAGEIFKQNPDILAFSCYIWNIESILEICQRLKLVSPNIIIILGGPEVSFDGAKILEDNPFLDFIICGEGERTFKELLNSLKENKNSFDHINGVICRNNGRIVQGQPREQIAYLDEIPSPFTEDMNEYKDRIVYYESSRGCPFNCQFCLSSTIKGVRYFSLDRVKDDLKKLIQAGVRQVKFVDRTFNAKKDYAIEIMRFIIEENPKNINFHFEVTAHLLDSEVLNFLKEAPEGLFQFEIGVQSTNLETLTEIDRKTDLEKLKHVSKTIKSFKNIHQHLDLIAGLPYEGYDSFRKSFNDIYNLRPEKLQLGFLKLLKGSGLRAKQDVHGFKFIDKPPYEVIETSYINYNDMLRLKIIEDLVERYANEENFTHALDFIITNEFDTPFDFFESFSIYWEKQGYHTSSHGKNELYKIINDYYNHSIDKNSQVFNEIIRYDFILNNKSPNIPKNFESSLGQVDKSLKHSFFQDEENIIKYVPWHKDQPVKKIIGNIHIERFSYDILNFISSHYNINKLIDNEVVLLFVYDDKKKVFEKCRSYDVSHYFITNGE